MTTCKSCGAPVLWVHTSKGSRMPVDANGDGTATTVPNGNLILERTHEGKLIAVGVPTGQGSHVSHFATCPNAASHRKGSR